MSQTEQTFLFFTKGPDLKNSLSFTAQIVYDSQRCSLSVFHSRILICRELVFSDPDIVATPSSFSTNQITAVILKKKFYSTEFQEKLKKMNLKILGIYDASPTRLQECLQYTATAKIAPQWNIVQNLLVQGRDFLTVSGPLRAVELDIYVNNNEITLSVKPKCIRLPQFKIENYLQMYEFSGNSISIEEKCHVLPSLKVGRAISLSRSLLSTSVFKNYADLKKHWKNMYGYRLPEIPEQNIWYMNVTFNVPFSPSYSYPAFCVRPFGMTEVPRIDPQFTLHSFISDFYKKVNNVCGEKCHILDLNASFPIAKLYQAQDVTEDMNPKLGTTYKMVQNMPYRSFAASQTDNKKCGTKLKQNETNLTERPSQTHSIIRGNELNSSITRENKQNLSRRNALENSKFKATVPYCNMESDRNSVIHQGQKSSEKCFEDNQPQYQFGYNSSQSNTMKIDNRRNTKNKVFVKSCILSTSCNRDAEGSEIFSSTNISNPTRKTPLKDNKDEQAKYAPKFFPKKPKPETKTLKLTDLFTKVKATKYTPNFSAVRKSCGSAKPLDLNSNSLNNNPDSGSKLNQSKVAAISDKSNTLMERSKITFPSRKSKKQSEDFTNMHIEESSSRQKRKRANVSHGTSSKDKKVCYKDFKTTTKKTTKV